MTTFSYSQTLGDIALAWNWLERLFHNIVLVHIREEPEVKSAILALAGNASKADLLRFLIKRREKDAAFADHLNFLADLFDRCREIRNIIIHSNPVGAYGQYGGAIKKLSNRGRLVTFEAEEEVLSDVAFNMIKAHDYALDLLVVLRARDSGQPTESVHEHLALI